MRREREALFLPDIEFLFALLEDILTKALPVPLYSKALLLYKI